MKNTFIKRFQYHKEVAAKSFDQLSEEQIFWKYNSESNSIATLVKHLSGNMQSRCPNFLTEDGEKSNRNRDLELENDIQSKWEMLELWNKDGQVLFEALNAIKAKNWNDLLLIRGEEHTVLDAVLEQLAHYTYHIGQIIYIGKMLKGEDWETLSTTKKTSEKFNIEKFENLDSVGIQENSSPVCYAKSDEVREDYKI